ncbi:MAG: alpha/beta hydrolase [Planctomycetaceae bacterium]|nr:alpha/beta hydrolase [Planctomycetaceae bacterium]
MIQTIHRISVAAFTATWSLVLLASLNAAELDLPPISVSVPNEPGTPAEIHSLAAPGFWIVDSHRSPQSFDDSPPAFCPNVTRYDQCAGYRQSDMPELTQSIQPGTPVCIFCHGSFVSWNDVLKESCETWKWLHHACPNQPIQMIYFSWPSDRPIVSPIIQLDVNRLGRRAGRNGFYLASLIHHIPSECPVCLMGHSHGTRVITSSLHLMAGGEVDGYVLTPGPCPHHRLRAVFAASAIDHNWMNPGYRYDRALHCVEGILNLQNECDAALFIYPLRHPFSGGALGFTGLSRKDRIRLGPYGSRIQDLNLTEELGAGHYWPNYFQRPWLAKTIRNYLFVNEN